MDHGGEGVAAELLTIYVYNKYIKHINKYMYIHVS